MPEDEPESGISIEAVRAILAPHAPLYGIQPPTYQTIFLRRLRAIWNPAHRRVLDVGGGTGLLAEAVRRLFPVDEVVSIDVEDRFVANLGIRTALFNGEALPFPDDSFDCAMMTNVLHHVPRSHRPKLVSECKRVAGPIYIKDHVATTVVDHARLQILDMLGNLPFKGMISAHYLELPEWRKTAACAGYDLCAYDAGHYRSGIMAALFPNRLECLFRFDPVHGNTGVRP